MSSASTSETASLACVYAQGRVVGWFEFAMTPEGVAAAFDGKGYARVALEAGAQSGWVGRQLKSLGYVVAVANPRKLKAISANKRKSDRNDAQMLAKLLWADVSLLHPIQPRSEGLKPVGIASKCRHTADIVCDSPVRGDHVGTYPLERSFEKSIPRVVP